MVRSKKIEDIDIRIGKALRFFRRRADRTQLDVATYIGVTYQQWQNYETAGNRLFASRLIMFCKFVDIDVSEFLKKIDKD